MDTQAECLFKQAHRLLVQAGYRQGRVRKLRQHRQRISTSIRAPGPSTPIPELPADLSYEEHSFTRSPPTFRQARYVRPLSKTPTPCGPLSSRDTPRPVEAEQRLDTQDRKHLQGLFLQLKQQEKAVIDQRLQVQFERRTKLGVFDIETNRTRKETSARCALSQRC